MPRVAIVFFGLARNTRRTIGAIRNRIYRPNAQGFELLRVASLNEIDSITNHRSRELGIALDKEDKFLLRCDAYLTRAQDDADIRDALQVAKQRADVHRDNWKSTENLLHQLLSLQRAWRHLEATFPDGIDHYAFLRPDLLYLDRLDLAQVIAGLPQPNGIAIPDWQPYRGLNDRFAVADAVAARHYANRIDHVAAFVRDQPLHAERLLRFAMTIGGCNVVPLPVRARRVRADGRVVVEDFTPHPIALGVPAPAAAAPQAGGSG